MNKTDRYIYDVFLSASAGPAAAFPPGVTPWSQCLQSAKKICRN